MATMGGKRASGCGNFAPRRQSRKERWAASIVLGRSGGQLSQWPCKVREVAGAEHLNTGVVFAIKSRDRVRAPRRHGRLWRAKPQPEVAYAPAPWPGLLTHLGR